MICHSVAGVGNKSHPLDGIGSKMKADELKKFLANPKAAKPDIIMKAYSNLPEKDMDGLVAYLMTLKK
jgi:cytochrome c2